MFSEFFAPWPNFINAFAILNIKSFERLIEERHVPQTGHMQIVCQAEFLYLAQPYPSDPTPSHPSKNARSPPLCSRNRDSPQIR